MLKRMGQRHARPGWALRDERGQYVSKPTGRQFAADPAEYILQMLDRIAEFTVISKWKRMRMPGGGAYGCLRFCMEYAALQIGDSLDSTAEVPGYDNLCLPLCLPPPGPHSPPPGPYGRFPGCHRVPMHRRHFLQRTKKGYLTVYLGLDESKKPVREHVHRLIMLAFGNDDVNALEHEGTGKGSGREVSHQCCNPWCCNRRHMVWATHKENMRTKPLSCIGNLHKHTRIRRQR